MVAPAISHLTVQEHASALLGLQNELAATMLQGASAGRLIDLAAELIRRADDLRARLPDAAEHPAPNVTGLHLFAQAARMYGFLLMRELNPDQVWFWTEEWQAGEREADAQLTRGDGTFYASTDEFIAAMDADLAALG